MRKYLIIASITLMVLVGTVLAAPAVPAQYWGTVTINGEPAPTGTLISAWISGTERGNITVVTPGTYGGPGQFDNRLLVRADQSEVGRPVTFIVAGYPLRIAVPFVEGAAQQVNLASDSPLQANFVGTPTSGDRPLSVQFTDQSTGIPTTWQWSFGDGTPNTTVASPSHTYSNAGKFTVALTVSNPQAGSSTLTRTEYISVEGGGQEPPIADFTASPRAGTAALFVQFTDTSLNTPTEWQWNFGDGGTSTVQHPSHTYLRSGQFTVTLVVNNTYGFDSRTQTNYITVVPAGQPTVDFTAIPRTGTAPLAVQFSDASVGENITAYHWNFGDGQTSELPNPSHVYDTAGEYTVNLTITSNGLPYNREVPKYITVDPKAAFNATPTEGVADLTVQFMDVSTGKPDTWEWGFGDATTGNISNPTHLYPVAGLYTISLRVRSNGRWSAVTVMPNYITVRPLSSFTAIPGSGYAPLNVTFSDTSTGLPNAWSWTISGTQGTDWQFVPPSTAASQNPQVTFLNANIYNVTLSASRGTVAGAAAAGAVTVLPDADFTASPTNIPEKRPVFFFDRTVGGTPDTWLWDFGDGKTSVERNPLHVYEKSGAYTVSLTVTRNGLFDTERKAGYIKVDSAVLPPLRATINGNTFFRADRFVVKTLETVTFRAYSTRDVPGTTAYYWDFGDGIGATGRAVTHQYALPGVYTVSLSIIDTQDIFLITKPRYIVVK
jgi:PKD repeat protein